jgi:hypothetical protein
MQSTKMASVQVLYKHSQRKWEEGGLRVVKRELTANTTVERPTVPTEARIRVTASSGGEGERGREKVYIDCLSKSKGWFGLLCSPRGNGWHHTYSASHPSSCVCQHPFSSFVVDETSTCPPQRYINAAASTKSTHGHLNRVS